MLLQDVRAASRCAGFTPMRDEYDTGARIVKADGKLPVFTTVTSDIGGSSHKRHVRYHRVF
jgi:hypothetical protein